MRVGWVGLGKLGLPCAVVLDRAGHEVIGYDVSPEPARYLSERAVPYREAGLPKLLENHSVEVADNIADLMEAGPDVVFVAVQTPHAPDYDGTRPAPAERRDFEYGHLVQAVRSVCNAPVVTAPVTVAVVSTVLPGTCSRHLRRLSVDGVRLVYNPAFIAMGTTVADFTNPEFVLIGADDPADAEPLAEVYGKVHDRQVRVVSVESAELTKVAYNVVVSAKVGIANYLGELAQRTGADADEVADCLMRATDRIVSPRYMRAGMGDGGGCHPRDLIALSWLAERTGMSWDLAAALMDGREAHSAWLAETVASWARIAGLPVAVLGKSYKPETDLTAGSPAALLVHQLDGMAGVDVPVWWDPHVDGTDFQLVDPIPAVYVVATAHDAFRWLEVPAGSVVVDPFGYMPDREGVTVVRPGRH